MFVCEQVVQALSVLREEAKALGRGRVRKRDKDASDKHQERTRMTNFIIDALLELHSRHEARGMTRYTPSHPVVTFGPDDAEPTLVRRNSL